MPKAMQQSMSPKDRVRAAFAHREPDRVPIYEQTVGSDVASHILGREAFTGTTYLHYQEACAWVEGQAAHEEFVERAYRDVADLTLALGFDMIAPPALLGTRPTQRIDENTFLYGDEAKNHNIGRFDPQAKTFYVVKRPGRLDPAAEDLQAYVEQAEEQAAQFAIEDAEATFPTEARLLKEFGDRLAVLGSVGIAVPLQQDWLMACAERPDLVARHLDVQVQRGSVRLEALARLGIEIIWGGGDLANNQGPIYGRNAFRDLVLPRIRRLVARCHELGMLYVFRTDGNLWPIEHEFLVESGTDGYGEIDYEAGMDLARLKERHGPRITFWGNVPCGTVLYHGSPQQVADFTRRIIDVAAPGGGLILGSSNCILPGTPPENLLAMVQTAREYGQY
jgi:uroporphyrinogen decarboxylase